MPALTLLSRAPALPARCSRWVVRLVLFATVSLFAGSCSGAPTSPVEVTDIALLIVGGNQ